MAATKYQQEETILILDANQRAAGTLNKPIFMFTEPLLAKSCSIINVSIPRTFYNVTVTHNTFVSQGVTYTCPVGLYRIDDLVLELNSIPGQADLIFSFNDISGKVSVLNNTGVAELWEDGGSGLLAKLGFTQLTYNIIVGDTIVGEEIPSIVNPVIKINSYDIASARKKIIYDKYNPNLIMTVPLSCAPFAYQDYQPSTKLRYDFLSEKRYYQLEFEFTELDGSEIDFNGSPPILTMQFSA